MTLFHFGWPASFCYISLHVAVMSRHFPELFVSFQYVLQAHSGTGVSHRQHEKNSGKVSEKMQVNGLEGYKLARKNFLATGVAFVAIF